MNKLIFVLSALVAAIGIVQPALADTANVGAFAGFGITGQPVIGFDARAGSIFQSLSLRPYINFGSGTTNYGGAVTFDLSPTQNSNSDFYIGTGIGYVNTQKKGDYLDKPDYFDIYAIVGVDQEVSNNLVFKGNVTVPLLNLGSSTTVNAGIGMTF